MDGKRGIPSVIVVHVVWDDEAKVWTASTDDIRGFTCEAATLEQLRDKAPLIVADLAEEWGSDVSGVEIEYLARVRDRLPLPA